MRTVVGIGEEGALTGFTLTGVPVITAENDSEIIAAWDDLDDDVGLVILSARASEVLRADLEGRTDRLSVVMP